jgi:hypothetical protein
MAAVSCGCAVVTTQRFGEIAERRFYISPPLMTRSGINQ